MPVFAVKGETLKDYWDYTAKLFEWHDGGTPNMILDDGGDATMFVHHQYSSRLSPFHAKTGTPAPAMAAAA